MAPCKRCGLEVRERTIHIFHGGEARVSFIQSIFPRASVSLCLQPFSDKEWAELQRMYVVGLDGELHPVADDECEEKKGI